jgi:hypothetical protein
VQEGLLDLCYLTKQLIAKDKYTSFSGNSFQSQHKKKDFMAGFNKTRLLPTLHICLCMLCPMSSGTELSAVVFDHYIQPMLILVIFSSGVF